MKIVSEQVSAWITDLTQQQAVDFQNAYGIEVLPIAKDGRKIIYGVLFANIPREKFDEYVRFFFAINN